MNNFFLQQFPVVFLADMYILEAIPRTSKHPKETASSKVLPQVRERAGHEELWFGFFFPALSLQPLNPTAKGTV